MPDGSEEETSKHLLCRELHLEGPLCAFVDANTMVTCRLATGGPGSPDAAYPPAGSSNAFKAQLRNHITPIAEEHAQRGGIPAAERDLYDHSAMAHSLEQDYLPVNLAQPGLSIQSLEPPVFTIDNFMTSEQCHQLAQAADATGELLLGLSPW